MSTGSSTSARIEREIKMLKRMPDSQVDFSDIPLQDPNDLKWKNAVRGRSYRPVLDVGCGINKHPGAIGLDRNPNTRADVIADLDHFPFPFRDGSFREVRATHVIEHVADVIRTMEEIHRLLAPGGRAIIVTPHYTDFSSFCDPTHRWHLNSFSLRYFTGDDGGFGYYSGARFREISTRVKLLALWRYTGFEFLVNRWRRFRRFWEFYLCYLVRGKVIQWELEAVKEAQPGCGHPSFSGN